MNKLLPTAFAMLWLILGVQAQSVDDVLQPVTSTYALKNVTIVQKPGQVIQNGNVVVKDGLIHAVGTGVKIPAYAKVLDADSMFVYAGFIDALSHVGIPAPKEEANNRGRFRGRIPGVDDPGNPPPDKAGITPQINAADKLSAEDKEIANHRKLGFTTVHVVPRGQMLPGKGAIVILAGDSDEDMVVQENVSMFAQFDPARGVFPSTLMGVMSKFREMYIQAQQLLMHHEKYQANPQKMTRPERNPELEALFPVIKGEQPVYFAASDIKDIYRVLTLQQDLGFKLVLAGVKQGWHVADMIKEKNIPVILSTDLPEAPKEKKDKEEKDMDEETKALQKRKMEALEKHVGQAATMAKAGIPFGLTTMDAKTKDMKENLARMMKAGLTEDQALAALTTTPAAVLGVDKVMGTVEKGKIANLVVSDTAYFSKKANVRFVIADGHVFEFEAPKKKPANGNAASTAAIDGSWSYEITGTPMGEISGTLKLSNQGGDVSGEISSGTMGTMALNNAILSGQTLTFSIPFMVDGQSLTIQYTLDFEGDTFDGKVSTGGYGSFDIEGSKKPE